MKEIVLSGFFGPDIKPENVRSQLSAAKGDDIEIIISSPGGDIFAGIDIYNQISDYKRKNPHSQILGKISGVAASMASYIAMNPSFDLVVAEDNAAFMVHNAWGVSIGDHNVMRKDADKLEGLTEPYMQLVAGKMKITEQRAKKLMDAETWFFGKQIVEAGLADEIISRPNSGSVMNEISAKAEIKNAYDEFSRKLYSEKFMKVAAMTPRLTVGSYSDSVEIIDQTWSRSDADMRWREHANATEAPNAKYREAFLWYDSENSENFTAYKLQVKDFVGGKEVVNIRAVNNADARLNQVDGPSAEDRDRIQSILDRYQSRWQRKQEQGSMEQNKIDAEAIKAEAVKIEKERVKALFDLKAKYAETPSNEIVSKIVDSAVLSGDSIEAVNRDIVLTASNGNTQAALESPGSTPQGSANTISGERAKKDHKDQWS